MNDTAVNFDALEKAELEEIAVQLRSEGWVDDVAVLSWLEAWDRLSRSVDQYEHSIDDYTNDLCCRDGLDVALQRASPNVRVKLQRCVAEADHEFMARTCEDAGSAVGRFYRIDGSSGWWWKRRPIAGALADYLAGSR